LEKVKYVPPYYLITANGTEFKTYTKSGVNISVQILDKFKVDYIVEYVKE
tara:strand:+ start:506 stop:655 length:150 start_codon:yes stop_codon:yes gene_type:complete